jgi:anthranilate synthase/aminodeoxychorismate synthase-like glutamine amidotransferase
MSAARRTRVLVLDNYDSFTYNLVQYLGELDADVHTVRNDRASVRELLDGGYERCVLSPGPCTPEKAGILIELSRAMPEAGVPTLGVCLGHQALAEAFGGRVQLHPPVHGKATTIEHDGRTIFSGLPSPLKVGRYHSLVVDPELPDCLEQTASGDGVLMALRHKSLPAEGVQCHTESVLTEEGRRLLGNFLGA